MTPPRATRSGSETGPDDPTGPDGEAGACAAAIPTFSSPSGSEFIQWDFGEGEKTAASDVLIGFDYYIHEQGVVTFAATADGTASTPKPSPRAPTRALTASG